MAWVVMHNARVLKNTETDEVALQCGCGSGTPTLHKIGGGGGGGLNKNVRMPILKPIEPVSELYNDLMVAQVRCSVPLEENRVYIVVYNGEEYECTSERGSYNDAVGLGNTSFYLEGGDDNGMPFYAEYSNEEMVILTQNPNTYIFAVYTKDLTEPEAMANVQYAWLTSPCTRAELENALAVKKGVIWDGYVGNIRFLGDKVRLTTNDFTKIDYDILPDSNGLYNASDYDSGYITPLKEIRYFYLGGSSGEGYYRISVDENGNLEATLRSTDDK